MMAPKKKDRATDAATDEAATSTTEPTTDQDVTTLEPTTEPPATDVPTADVTEPPTADQPTADAPTDAEPVDEPEPADEPDILYDAAYDAVSAYIMRGFAAAVADKRAEADNAIADVRQGLAALEAAGVNGSAKAALLAELNQAEGRRDMATVDEAEVARRVDNVLMFLERIADPSESAYRPTGRASTQPTPRTPRATTGDTDRTAEKYRAVVDGTELHGSNCNQLGTLAWNRLHLRTAGAKVIADAFAAQYSGDSLSSYLAKRGLPLRAVTIRCPEGHDHMLNIGPLLETAS